MDTLSWTALITLFLTLIAFGYWRLRKPAADRGYRFGGREAEQQPTAVGFAQDTSLTHVGETTNT